MESKAGSKFLFCRASGRKNRSHFFRTHSRVKRLAKGVMRNSCLHQKGRLVPQWPARSRTLFAAARFHTPESRHDLLHSEYPPPACCPRRPSAYIALFILADVRCHFPNILDMPPIVAGTFALQSLLHFSGDVGDESPVSLSKHSWTVQRISALAGASSSSCRNRYFSLAA